MRIVINGLAALKPRTGVGHHVARLIEELPQLAPDDQFWAYPGKLLARMVTRAVAKPTVVRPGHSPNRVPRLAPLRTRIKQSAKVAAQLHFQAASRLGRFDLYHEPNFVPFASSRPTVVTVHDLSVVRFPQWHPADRVAQHTRHFERMLHRADHVIVVSEAVRREMIQELGFPAHRVTAVPNGVGPEYRPQDSATIQAIRQKYKLPDSFFLSVGTVEPRKNLLMAMQAFVALPPLMRQRCPLILAGPWGWKSERERTYFDTVASRAGVRHLGYVAAADLPGLYGAARALVYPSFYEGFGLPPLEMIATGGMVLASTDPAVQEVVGPHAVGINPMDFDGWRDAMIRAASEPDWFASVQKSGPVYAQRFTWTQAAHQTLRVYRSVLGIREIPQLLHRAA
jgi:alpha-1,3-rhamnosyl/mannosyltransferase